MNINCSLIENPLDIFYLTKLKVSAGKLLIKGNEKLLLLDGRYIERGKVHANCPVSLDSKQAMQTFFKGEKEIHFDAAKTSYERFLQLKEILPDHKLTADNFESLRAIKTPEEIEKMKESARLLWKGFEHIQTLLIPGVTEKSIAKQFEIFCLEQGADSLSFDPIIAFGQNTAYPHYQPSNTALQKGDIALVDIGVVIDSYHSDMTRTLLLDSKDAKLAQFLDLTKKAQKAALDLCRPGTLVKNLDLAARAVFKENEPLFSHSLGHGIGLETHEYPRISSKGKHADIPLEEGMVITIEPGLYLPGTGGVRYEDTIAITSSSYDNFYPLK